MSEADRFGSYRTDREEKIRAVLSEKACQPILFIGSGISMRYFDAPTWHNLLRLVVGQLDDGLPSYDYYLQKHSGDAIKIGSVLADRVMEWAWKSGKDQFPAAFFEGNPSGDVFIKYMVSQMLESLTPSVEDLRKKNVWSEIELLTRARPHAIITTNFDPFLERVFDGYETIVGQQVLKYNLNSFGEIFKIHGSVSDPQSIVLTTKDYENFIEEQKYISAKLLTYFIEHPIFVFGYSFNDPNVASIIADVGKIVSDAEGLIPNIFYVEWDAKAENRTSFPVERLITSGDRQYRVQSIVTSDFGWVFEALAVSTEISSMNTKLVRALAARVYKLVREDIPRGKVEVDYKLLEGLTNDAQSIPKVLGITPIGNPVHTHLYNLSDVARKIGLHRWQYADHLIDKIRQKSGINIKSNDNKYHCKVKNGGGFIRKYSEAAVKLLQDVKDGKDVRVEL